MLPNSALAPLSPLPTIICLLCGPPASGKSTLCSKIEHHSLTRRSSASPSPSLEEGWDVDIIDYDVIRDETLHDMRSQAQSNVDDTIEIDSVELKAWHEGRKVCEERLRALLNTPLTKPRIILLDDTFHLRSYRKPIITLARNYLTSSPLEESNESYRGVITVVYMTPDTVLEMCTERNKTRQASRIVSDETIKKIFHDFEKPGFGVNCGAWEAAENCFDVGGDGDGCGLFLSEVDDFFNEYYSRFSDTPLTMTSPSLRDNVTSESSASDDNTNASFIPSSSSLKNKTNRSTFKLLTPHPPQPSLESLTHAREVTKTSQIHTTEILLRSIVAAMCGRDKSMGKVVNDVKKTVFVKIKSVINDRLTEEEWVELSDSVKMMFVNELKLVGVGGEDVEMLVMNAVQVKDSYSQKSLVLSRD